MVRAAPDYYRRLIAKFFRTPVLVVGDVMVDRFVRGKVSRISPEAPVPVVRVGEESDLPGGAGNVITNLAALGGQVLACGVVGEDEAGRALLGRFARMGVDTQGIRLDSSRRTTLKTRVIAEHQQVVRFDHEDVGEMPPVLRSQMIEYIEETVPKVSGVILSDYGKGVIGKDLLKRAIASARRHGKPVCVDPKIEHFLSYQRVTCITPNLNEAVGGMRRVRLGKKEDLIQLGRDILRKLRSDSVLITRGEEGMSLFEKNRVTHIPAKAREVFDVTGAGDTVISVLTLALACGADLPRAAVLSNLAAGIVVGKLGTATVSPDELREALKLL